MALSKREEQEDGEGKRLPLTAAGVSDCATGLLVRCQCFLNRLYLQEQFQFV